MIKMLNPSIHFKINLLPTLILIGFTRAATAQSPATIPTLPEMTVIGAAPSTTQVTDDIAASPASVSVLGRRELDRKNITTYGDIFRGIPGLSVAEYGQGLVAYELKFRGFTSGHGRDIATYLDGVPLNITGSQHINGYMDQAQIIPELLDRVEIVRGPFSAAAGNHAVAGSIQMFTDRTVQSSLKLSVDNFGRTRVLPIYSTNTGPGQLLLALDLTKGSGYTNQSDVERTNMFSRYSLPIKDGMLALRFQSYHADAQAPGFLDLARIESGQINRRDALNKGLGDRKNQNNLVLNYRSNDAEGLKGLAAGWTASAYLVRDKRERFTNFDLTLPSFSTTNLGTERDQLQQFGLDVKKVTTFTSKALPSQLAIGVQYNRERILATNFTSDAFRNVVQASATQPDAISIDRTMLTSTQSVYGQLQLKPLDALKLTLGLRYDKLDFDVALRPDDDTYSAALAVGASPNVRSSATRFSPKVGAGLKLLDNGTSTIELYVNIASGLKSPYTFSDFYANVSANSASVPDLTVSTLRSSEIGLSGTAKDHQFFWRIGIWDTTQDREADRNSAGFFQSFGRTTRKGFDLEGSFQLTPTSRVFANYSAVKARSLSAPANANYITNVPEWTASFGVASTYNLTSGRLDFSVEGSLVGPQSITTDNLSRGSTYNRFSAKASYRPSTIKGLTLFAGLVTFNNQFQEPRFDFGGGLIGVSPRPRLALNIGTQYTF